MRRLSSPIGRRTRRGYILLISIIAIGIIASAILSSILMLGMSAGQEAESIEFSNQALTAAEACSEYALLKLRSSPTYAGNEVLDLSNGKCEIMTVGGIGNNNRLLCLEGTAADTTRRLEIVISTLIPTTKIQSWQEVSSFTLCK
jgi:hypothetical protein